MDLQYYFLKKVDGVIYLYIKVSTYNKYGKLKEIIQFYKIGSFKTRHKVQFLYIKSY